MRLLLAILLLAAGAYGQIANPTTASSLGLGWSALTNTNAANFRSAIGLGSWAELNDGSSVRVESLNISDGEQENYTQFTTAGVSFNGGNDLQFREALSLGTNNAVTFSNITARGTLAVTGNVTMSGVNNTATQQTASSASSLMTRQLTDNNPLWALGSVRPMGAYSFGSSGSPATAIEAVTQGGAFVNTGTNTNGYGRASLYQGINDSSIMTGQGIRFNQSISVSAVLTFLVRSNSVIRLIVGGNGGVPASGTSDAIGTRGFGLEAANDAGSIKFRLFAHNGTTYTNSAYTAALPVGFTNQSHIIIRNETNGLVSLFCANSALNKAPSRPSTTPLLTLSNGPTSGFGGAFVDLVAVTLTNTAVASGGQAVFYNGMVEVKD